MKISKVVQEFLDKVKIEKVNQLLGIALDTKYWKEIIGKVDMAALRTKLSEENNKGKDKADAKVIGVLSLQINNGEKAIAELVRLESMEKAIHVYLKFVKELDEDTLESLEGVAKL